MDLSTMRGLVRRDLKDETAESYRWADEDIDRAIDRAVAEFSRYSPSPQKNAIETVDGSREMDISSLTDRLSVDQVEFPIDEHPRIYQRFSVYQDTLTLLGAYEGDGENCNILWTKLHTLVAADTSNHDENSIILTRFQAEATGNITEIKVKAGVSGNVKVAIYTDSGGAPGSLINSTGSNAVTAGWNTITIASTAISQGTYYWLALNSDTLGAVRYNNQSGTMRYKASAFADAWPDPAGTGYSSRASHSSIAGWGVLTGAAAEKLIGAPSDPATSTIPTRYEYLIALAACVYALETYSDHTLVEQLQTALESAATALGNVSGQITDAETALTSAAGVDSDIATEITAAKAEIAKAAAAIADAIATGAGSIDADVDTALTAAAARITAAVSSIGSADTPLGSIAARLTAAIASLASGDDYMNTANIGGDVAASWADYARADVDIAHGYNREADGYLTQAEQDLTGALRELGIAEETAKKKDANIGAGDGYVRTATGYLGTARELNNKRLAYLTAADRYIQTTQAYITQANQHNQSAAQYNSLSKSLSLQAKTKRAELQREFKAILRAKGVKLTTMYRED